MSNKSSSDALIGITSTGIGVSGLMCFTLSGFIALTIFRYTPLRHKKEYFILGGLATADCFRGLVTVIVAVDRIWILIIGQSRHMVTPLDCALKRLMVGFFATSFDSFMLLTVSIDRLYATAFPISYFKQTVRYAQVVLMLVLICSFVLVTIPFYSVFLLPDEPIIPAFCPSVLVFPFLYIFSSVQACNGFVSVIIYVLIPPIYIHQKNKVHTEVQRQQAFSIQQRRLIKTMGYSTIFTFFLLIIPLTIRSYVASGGYGIAFHGSLTIMRNFNGIANFWLYYVRHKDLRKAMKYSVKCKYLPPNFDTQPGVFVL